MTDINKRSSYSNNTASVPKKVIFNFCRFFVYNLSWLVFSLYAHPAVRYELSIKLIGRELKVYNKPQVFRYT